MLSTNNSIGSYSYHNQPYALNNTQQAISAQPLGQSYNQANRLESFASQNSIVANAEGHSCNSFVNYLMQGVADLILKAVSSFLGNIGIDNQAAVKTDQLAATRSNQSATTSAVKSEVSESSWLEKGSSFLSKGIELLSNVFGGKLGSIFNASGLGGKIVDKAKDWIGKIF